MAAKAAAREGRWLPATSLVEQQYRYGRKAMHRRKHRHTVARTNVIK